jgi:NAD(P)H-hydrate epimerase
VCYPKPTDKPLYNGLVTQCKALGMPFLSLEQLQHACSQPQQQGGVPAAGGSRSSSGLAAVADVVVDALFGFSFKGSPRAPFDSLLQVKAVALGLYLA